MAFKLMLIATITAMALAASPAFAADYIVGWKLGVNYTHWAEGQQFFLGDRLIGDHNVYKVNGTAFKNCAVPPPSEALTTGNDVITLATPGRKWYICGVESHCALGMKLVINVAPFSAAPTPAPAPVVGADTPTWFWNNWKLKMRF